MLFIQPWHQDCRKSQQLYLVSKRFLREEFWWNCSECGNTKLQHYLKFNFIEKLSILLCYCICLTMEHTLMFDAIFSSECNEPLFSCKNQLLKTIISINVWLVWTITLNCHLFSWHIFEQHKWLLNFLHSQFLWGCLFRLPSQ